MCIFNGFSSFNRRKIMIAFIILKVRRPSHLKLWIMRSLRFRIAKFCGTTTMPFWVRSNEPTFYISSIFALLSKRSILLPWNWHKDLCGEGVDFTYLDVSTFVRIMIEKPWIVLPSYKYLEAWSIVYLFCRLKEQFFLWFWFMATIFFIRELVGSKSGTCFILEVANTVFQI